MLDVQGGTVVECADGTVLGAVDRFVVNPSSRLVTHVVIDRGAFFTEERVVPLEVLDQEPAGQALSLRLDVTPEDLPVLEHHHYVELDPQSRARLVPHAARAYTWSNPVLSTSGYPAFPAVPPASAAITTDRNVPDDTLTIDEGTSVISADGVEVGTVRGMEVGDDERLKRLMDSGDLRRRRSIPAHWIEGVAEDVVQLAINAATLDESDRT